MRIPAHIVVCFVILMPSFVHSTTPLDIATQLSLANPIVLAVIAYLPLGLVAIYVLIALATRKTSRTRAPAVAAIACIALAFAGACYPDWLIQRNSRGIEIGSFLGKDEMFLSTDLVKRFEQKFGTATVQWSQTGGGPWLTVPRDKYSPSMDAFLAQEAQHKVEPDGPANRSQPVQPGTNSTPFPAGYGR
jgi:hypothetical protein